jgi:hypothetical protein
MWRWPATGVGAAAVLLFAVAFTPLGSYAQGLIDVLRPQQFAVVPVTLADVQAIPDLDTYGEFTHVAGGRPEVRAGLGEAAAATGMTVLTPGGLPASVSAAPTYLTVPSQSATFTFSAEKARAAAQAQRKPLPPMPDNIDGASVQVTTGEAVVAVYGAAHLFGGPSSPAREGDGGLSGLFDDIPQLVVIQAKAPAATTTGASAAELRDYLLRQPGISRELANAVRAVGDPATTWPIPVPAGEVDTRTVSLHGVRGTAFREISGLAAGVIWIKDGIVYFVGAPLDEDDVLAIAHSLR